MNAKTARFDGERNIVAELCKKYLVMNIFIANSKNTHILLKQ